MATSKEYIDFVLDQLSGIDGIGCRKMFGEYMIYKNEKPVLIVCDNTVMVKKLPELAELLSGAPEGIPYDGSKPHYILDIEDLELTGKVIETAEKAARPPKKRTRKS